jgi:streptogramin lyase
VSIETSGVAIASDGQVFVSDYGKGRIGRVTGTRFEWTNIGPTAAPSGLAAADDGSVWFVSLGQPNQVGRVDAQGTLTTYALPFWPNADVYTYGSAMARAPDGSFWFTVPEPAQLGRVDTDGNLSFIPLPDNSLPRHLAFDPQGRLWFTSVPGFGRIEF